MRFRFSTLLGALWLTGFAHAAQAQIVTQTVTTTDYGTPIYAAPVYAAPVYAAPVYYGHYHGPRARYYAPRIIQTSPPALFSLNIGGGRYYDRGYRYHSHGWHDDRRGRRGRRDRD